MAKSVTLYKIFLASPGDMQEERTTVAGIVNEINDNSSEIKLELVKWETHTFPGFGVDAQDVINDQTGDDYDIFIGLMWKRFGTPTGRAGSGTEEEFNNAYEKHFNTPGSVQIMFYFKTAPIPFEEINPEQISKINSFKKKLGDVGGYYWQYSEVIQLERQLRVHLRKALEKLVQSKPTVDRPEIISEPIDDDDDDDELGLFDYLTIYEESFNEVNNAVENMAELIVELSKKMEERTEEINVYNKLGGGNNTSSARLIDKVSRDLDNYVHRMNSEIPIFSESLNRGVDAAYKAFEGYRTLGADVQNEDYVNGLKGLTGLKESIIGAEKTVTSFKSQIASIPNLTKKFAKSKKGALEVQKKIIDQMNTSIEQIEQIEITFG